MYLQVRWDIDMWLKISSGLAIAGAVFQFLYLILLFTQLPVFSNCCSGMKNLGSGTKNACCLPGVAISERKEDNSQR